MSEFSPSYLEIDEQELVKFLLNETGQNQQSQIAPQDLLDYLKLKYIQVDFEREILGIDGIGKHQSPRALISFHDRLIASDASLDTNRTRFSVLHEIGHYILPSHQNSLYICDSRAMGFDTQIIFEQEANRVAASLLFLGDRFDVEANSHSISAQVVKMLATAYGASFEATARRIAERTYRDCMFISFARENMPLSNESAQPQWKVRYCIASPSFRNKYFSTLTRGSVPIAIAQQVNGFTDISQSVTNELDIPISGSEEPKRFLAEYFYNSFNVFCFLVPK